MKQLTEIAFALFCLILIHWAVTAAIRRARQGVGKAASAVLRPVLRHSLTAYYTSKVTRQMRKQGKANGAPPLENPDLE
jgi:hypothetical protein